MARRKVSTFERLQRGEQLNRKERREVQQRLNLDDPDLDIIHRDAAGIDVGKREPLRFGSKGQQLARTELQCLGQVKRKRALRGCNHAEG